MREIVADWYALLSTLYVAVALPLRTFGDGLGLPLVSALLFGVIGAAAPCQLTTAAGALAYVARDAGDRRAAARQALAYLLGKALVYTVVGVAVILAGQHLARATIPVIVVVRKALGPLMILLGLSLLGLVMHPARAWGDAVGQHRWPT